MKRWKTVVLLLFWLLLFGPAAVYGSEKAAITMEVEYGFKGNVKMGSCFPVRVTVENPGEPMDDVTLLLKVPLRTDNGNIYSSIWMNGMNQGGNRDRIYTYRKKISLQKGEKKTETFYLELPMFEGTVQIYAQTDGEILAETELNCSFVENSSRILIGVVAENPEGITELDGTRVNMENGDVPEAFVKMIPLEPEEIYPNPKALKQLDLLIADKTTEFSEEQQVALSRWKNSGGFYLEREDENLSDLFRRFQNGEQRENFSGI